MPGMTNSQRITIALSKVRERLNTIAGMDPSELTAELRSERDQLVTDYGEQEAQLRAAVTAEDAEAKAAAETLGDGDGGGDNADSETVELRSLIGRATLSGYLMSFAADRPLVGAERELYEHRELSPFGRMIPWDVLQPVESPELRADVVTPVPSTGIATNQAAVLQRVFAPSVALRLGVAMPQVASGEGSFPVLTGGATPSYVAQGAAKDAAAATITPNTVKPVRMQARFLFEMESAIAIAGLEETLRGDLAMAMSDRLDAQVIGAGDAQVRGFLATQANGGLTTRTGQQNAVTFATAAAETAVGVDGKFAQNENACTWCVGVATYQKLAGLIAGNTAVSATERAGRVLRGFFCSSHIPAVASNRQQGIMAKLGAGGANAIAPMWRGLEFVRDPYSNTNEAKISITCTMFSNFAILRRDAYVRTGLEVA